MPTALVVLFVCAACASAVGPRSDDAGGEPQWTTEELSVPITADPRNGIRPPEARIAWQDDDRMHVVVDDQVLSSADGTTWTVDLAPVPMAGRGVEDRRTFTDQLELDDRSLLVGSVTGSAATAEPSAPDQPAMPSDSVIRPAVWSSTDRGRTWTLVSSPAFEAGGDIISVATTPIGLVAAGVHRPNGSVGPFTPAVWASGDGGLTWRDVALAGPPFEGDTSLRSIAVLGDDIVVSGRRDFRPALWTTTDLEHWEDATGPIEREVEVVGDGARIVALGSDTALTDRDEHPIGWVTTDLDEWTEVHDDPAVFGDVTGPSAYSSTPSTPLQLSSWSGRFVVLGAAPTRSDPQFCFQDLATCQGSTSFVATSTDGVTWQRIAAVDTDDTNETARFTAAVLGSAPPAIVALRVAPRNESPQPRTVPPAPAFELWRSAAPGWPTDLPATVPTTTEAPLPMLDLQHPELAVGDRARVQWFVGCGSGFVLGDDEFVLADPEAMRSWPHEGWPARALDINDGPNLMILGTLERPSEDELVFTVEGTDDSIRLVPGDLLGCM